MPKEVTYSKEILSRIALEEFIKSCDFSWTVDRIMEELNKKNEGIYISHSAKLCCEFYEKFMKRL